MALTQRDIDVRDARVTINMLSVDGRTFTPVLFRQIPRRKLIDAQTMELHGEPFGWVHYFWGNCVAGSHLHVVWIDAQGSLWRDCIYPVPTRGAFAPPEWKAFYEQMQALPQLFIDGDHSDVHA